MHSSDSEPTSAGAAREAAEGAAPLPGDTASLPVRIVGDPVPHPTQTTQRLYASDWARFSVWCREQGRAPLPTTSQSFAAYLLAIAPGLSRGALGRHRAAIGTMHRQSGLPIPLLDAATRKALRSSARRSDTSRPARPTSTDLRRLAKTCPRDLCGLRDRALLLLVAALTRPGARAKSATPGSAAEEAVPRLFLLALDAEHVRFTATGMALQLRSGADQTEPSRNVTLTRAIPGETCAVRAMEDWLRASDTAFGPVFRKVDRWGNVEHGRLHPDAWNRILARREGSSRPSRGTTRKDR